MAEACLTLIVGHLSRSYGRHGRKALDSPSRNGLGRLLSWIEIHLAEDLSLPSLVAESGLSERTFRRRFAELTGQTPSEYVLDRRLERAKGLLKTRPRPSVAEIAARCGFDDPNYFSRRWRDRLGVSPLAWAKR